MTTVPTRENCLTGHNLARRCDAVFAEVLTPEAGELLAFDHVVTERDDRRYVYYRKDIALKDGDTVFCKIDYVDRLFRLLRWRWRLKDIKLVTGQSDYPVARKLFRRKPRCIARWYGVNVDFDHPDLVPIPLGLQDETGFRGMKVEELTGRHPAADRKLLYVNHRIDTNPRARSWAYDRWSTNDWLTVDPARLDRERYLDQLDRHAFVLSPWGNGVDCYRLWEALYHGIIPVTDRHTTYRATEGLPVLLVDSLEHEIDRDFLLGKLETFRNRTWRYEKLNVDWWYERIKAGASI